MRVERQDLRAPDREGPGSVGPPGAGAEPERREGGVVEAKRLASAVLETGDGFGVEEDCTSSSLRATLPDPKPIPPELAGKLRAICSNGASVALDSLRYGGPVAI